MRDLIRKILEDPTASLTMISGKDGLEITIKAKRPETCTYTNGGGHVNCKEAKISFYKSDGEKIFPDMPRGIHVLYSNTGKNPLEMCEIRGDLEVPLNFTRFFAEFGPVKSMEIYYDGY